jgi:phage gp29-like protein
MPILDQYGQPIPTKPPENRIPSGAIGLENHWRSYPLRGLNPVRLTNLLRDADDGELERQSELFEDMEEKDGYLFAQLQTRKLAITGLDWAVKPADSSSEAKRIAEAFAAVWANIDQETLLGDLADAIPKGVSVINMAWTRDGGIWTPSTLEHIPASKLIYRDGQFKVRTLEFPMGLALEFGAAIEHRFKARSGSPTRAGLMRTIAWWFLFKHYGVKDWLAFAELFGVPLRLGKYDPSTGDDERRALEVAVRSIGSDGAGVISRDTEIEIIEIASKGGAEVFQNLVTLCNREIALTVLGQTLTSSEGEHGTQALGNVHQKVREDLLIADVKAIARTLKDDLARAFVAFNFGADKLNLTPSIRPAILDDDQLKMNAETLQILQGMGLEIPENWLRSKFGVPAPQEGERTLTMKPKTTALERRLPLEQITRELPTGVIEGQAFTTALIGNSSDAAKAAFEPNVNAVLEVVQSASSYDDALEKLLKLMPDMGFDALSELVSSAMKIAVLAGQYAGRQRPKPEGAAVGARQ